MEQHKISELRINHGSKARDLQVARAKVMSKSTLDDVRKGEAYSACNKPFIVDELVVFYWSPMMHKTCTAKSSVPLPPRTGLSIEGHNQLVADSLWSLEMKGMKVKVGNINAERIAYQERGLKTACANIRKHPHRILYGFDFSYEFRTLYPGVNSQVANSRIKMVCTHWLFAASHWIWLITPPAADRQDSRNQQFQAGRSPRSR